MLLAFWTKSNIFATVESPNSFSTSIVKSPFLLITPLKILSPLPTSLGTLSPVNAAVSTMELPSITLPSNGTFSPGFTTIISPMLTSSGSTFLMSPFIFKLAKSGLISIRAEIDFLERLTAIS